MRVSLINLNFVSHDAIGQCMLHQLRFFRRRGDAVVLYTMHPPVGVSEDVVALTKVVSLADLIAGHDDHFFTSDLYVYHYPGRYPLMESIKGLERGAVIFYYHNVTPPNLWGSDFEREALEQGVAGVGELAPFADLVVAASQFNADQMVEQYAYDKERVHVLHIPVAIERFAAQPKQTGLVEQYQLNGRRVILFVGRMAGSKRFDLLIEALPLIQRDIPEALLMLVGDHDSNPAFEDIFAAAQSRIADLGLTDDVIFTGVVEDQTPYYHLAEIYASASLHEGFGAPLVEAMAAGVPVVASNTTAHPLTLGEAGLLVEPEDVSDLAAKIVQVLTDDTLYGDLVQRGLARAKTFSVERYETEWAKIIAEATAWLPQQPYPRPSSLLAQTVAPPQPQKSIEKFLSVKEILLNSELHHLESSCDVMLRGYVVHSGIPFLGSFVAWLRRNLTSHLREPYVDPTFERQVSFNYQVIHLMRQLILSVSYQVEKTPQMVRKVVKRQRQQAERFELIEARLNHLTERVYLLESRLDSVEQPSDIATIRQQVEDIHNLLSDTK